MKREEKYCPYDGFKLEPIVFTDANSELICTYCGYKPNTQPPQSAEEFLKECRKDKEFKNAVDSINNQIIIDFAEAYANQQKQVSDEEIENTAEKRWGNGKYLTREKEGFRDGAKWMRDKLTK